ncbi:dnaJ homolog subfamily C member 17-like [Stylophora pistillata]|uniref:DnaJ-like subfamily C member 17 n=1 Tax=Stylophora pistillata TaxID=50429 RepID=A0A2B4SGT8_STYPI|nr:dnaJ homolog subfamily C member 17-like [Stylophora pistillata]PFX27655.1 DnaJ-like subfamily C member 17 [Stylophora pistillata]
MADKLTYYEILGVGKESSLKEIAKAYRKKALKCHPDKNPDNPRALELFHELSKALEVLSDPKAKAAYDAVLKAKELARLRTQALDAKRKKFKQDLEAREDAAKTEKENDEMAAKNLEAEIKRLREEGSKLLKEQQELLRDQLKKEVESDQYNTTYQNVTPKLKVRWKSKKSDLTNGGYTQEMIRSLLEKYGEVSYVIVSSKKKGSAVAEFTSMASAKLAVENELGIPDNPLKISWLDGEPCSNNAKAETDPGISKLTRDFGEASDK